MLRFPIIIVAFFCVSCTQLNSWIAPEPSPLPAEFQVDWNEVAKIPVARPLLWRVGDDSKSCMMMATIDMGIHPKNDVHPAVTRAIEQSQRLISFDTALSMMFDKKLLTIIPTQPLTSSNQNVLDQLPAHSTISPWFMDAWLLAAAYGKSSLHSFALQRFVFEMAQARSISFEDGMESISTPTKNSTVQARTDDILTLELGAFAPTVLSLSLPLIRAFRGGDLGAIEIYTHTILDDFEYDRLVAASTPAMAIHIQRVLNQDSCLVVVPAVYLTGKSSLMQRLSALGITSVQI